MKSLGLRIHKMHREKRVVAAYLHGDGLGSSALDNWCDVLHERPC